MKTKAEIVQRLIEEEKITAEEAVTLLMGSKEYVYIPTYPAAPYMPFQWTTHTIGIVTPSTIQ